MPISRNTYQGLLGVTTTSVSGVWNIDELEDAPLSYFAPNIVSTASTDNATTITLPSGITAGQTILIFAGSSVAITTTSLDPYTRLQGNDVDTGVNPCGSIFYKISDGTESGTSLRVTNDATAFGCAVLDRGTPDNFGTLDYFNGANAAPAPGSITPSRGSLIFLSSFVDTAASSDPTNSVGFTDVVIDGTNGTGGAAADFYVWSKVSDGTATGIATVNWSASRATANLFSFSKRSITNRSAATLISTSSGIGNTMTLGTVNSGNLIFLFLSGRTTPVAPSGFTSSIFGTDNPDLVIATKISNGTETTLTGTWDVAASVVVDGYVSGIGGPVEVSATTSITTKNTLPSASLCAYWTVIDNTSSSMTTPPSGWTERHNPTGSIEEGYLYTREYSSAQQTGNVTATWSSTSAKTAILVSFYK